jgi:hypothetical protein
MITVLRKWGFKMKPYKSKYTESVPAHMPTSMKDSLLPGITYEELIDTVYSNMPAEKITPEAVMKTFKEILNDQVSDAMFELRSKMMDTIIQKAKEG